MTNAPASRMNNDPYPLGFVRANFNKMISTPKAAQLFQPIL
jgi:hypothetical protein